MQRQPVESSNIASIGTENGVIEVEFKGGRIYQYPDCDPDLCQKFMAAPSKGEFFGKHVKNRPFRKVGQ